MELQNSVPHYIAQVPAGLIALSNRPSRFGKNLNLSVLRAFAVQTI